MKRRKEMGPSRAISAASSFAGGRHGRGVPALRRADEHLDQVVVHAVVEVALEGPGELRVLDVAGVDGRVVGVQARGRGSFSSMTSSMAPLCSRAEKSSSACS